MSWRLGGEWVHGVTAIVYILVNNSSMVSYYVCRTCMYTIYLSYTTYFAKIYKNMEFVVFVIGTLTKN